MKGMRKRLAGAFTAAILATVSSPLVVANNAGEVVDDLHAAIESKPDCAKAQTVEYQFKQYNARYEISFSVDSEACAQLHKNPIDGALVGEVFADELMKRGAVLHDVGDEPAIQEFDLRTGKRLRLVHYRNGQMQDPFSGDAAFKMFDPQSGKTTVLMHFQNGSRHNPAPGNPAVQEFDGETGSRTYLGFYRNGLLQDTLSGEFAEQYLDPQTDIVFRAASYKDGQHVRYATREELIELNTRKGISPQLLDFLYDHEQPIFRPSF